MFNELQIERLYQCDLRVLQSDAAQERFLEEGRPFIVRPLQWAGAFRVPLKELVPSEVLLWLRGLR